MDARPGAGLTILLIEDNADFAESLRLLLEVRGHRAVIARDGREGVKLAGELRPDVVLCDIGLPGELDGYAVARELRSTKDGRATCLVALTGFGHEEARKRAEEAGFHTHLVKPIEFVQLERILAEVSAR